MNLSRINRRQFSQALAAAALPSVALSQVPTDDLSQLAWLEEVDSGRALEWVNAQDKSARQLIEAMPGYKARYDATLAAVASADNIQAIQRDGDYLYNFYNNTRNPHGIWRRTTLESYRLPYPRWQVLFNFDDLAKKEQRKWAMAGLQRDNANRTRAMIALSDAGKDEVELREFDLEKREFVSVKDGGFFSPTSKQRFTWAGQDALFIATNFGSGSMTNSGYAGQLRYWKRGQPLQEAQLISQVKNTDVSIHVSTEGLPHGHALVSHAVRFHDYERFYWNGSTLTALVLPTTSWAWAIEGYLVCVVRQDWQLNGKSVRAGSVIAAPIDLKNATSGQWQFHLLYEPPSAPSYGRFERTERIANGFAVLAAENMVSKLFVLRWTGNGFDRSEIQLPAAQSGQALSKASIAFNSADESKVWLTIESPVTPRVYGLLDCTNGKFEKFKEQKSFFDGSVYQVEQLQARSHDGTQVPYTIIRHKERLGSVQPTLLYGYGGFGISLEMSYQREVGINWLEHGGVYVMAHIRGGGELGDAWRTASLREKRFNSYEDFMAVARDLVTRGITTSKQLGIYGASNGGVLTSTVMARAPQLFGAVVSRVPLTDMLGYTKLTAGPSWVDESGNPEVPKERATLAAWSPLHNVKAGVTYPPLLLVGNRNDDRVHPAHARKLAFRMQQLGAKAWIIEAAEGGHSDRTTPELFATREAALYTFLMQTLK